MKNILLFVSFFSFILSSPIHTSGQNVEKDIDILLQDLFPSDGPGGTAIVVKNGKTIYKKAFGLAHLELNVPMKTDNIFRIGSITKQFTACAILKLAEENKLKLEDDITKFIPDYPTHDYTITIEHLLTHTSGIKSYTGMPQWTSEVRKKDFTPTELVDYFKNEEMEFAPGEKWNYNNSAYVLLGYIIEKVSGKSYEEYIEENFFAPLGMTHSFYGNSSEIIKGYVGGYMPQGDYYKNADFLSMTQPYSAGSLVSNVDDLYTWYEAVMNYKVVSKESIAKAHRSYKLNDGKETNYGYGWSVGNIQGHRMIGHGGGINGFLSASLYLPEDKVFVAVLSNCNCHAPNQVANQLAAIALGKPYSWKAISLTSEQASEYPAVYENESGTRTITAEAGKLYSMRTGGSKLEIFPYAKDKFFFENSTTTLEFIRNAAGEITEVVSKSTVPDETWKITTKTSSKPDRIELSEETAHSYIGEYQLAPEFIIVISREGKAFYAQATGQAKIEVIPYELNKFYADAIDIKLVFNSDNANKVTSLTLIQNGEHKADKIK